MSDGVLDSLGQTVDAPSPSAFLRDLFARWSMPEVLAQIEWLRGLKVLVVGEAILDEYVTCDAMGKSGKEPVLITRYRSRDLHAGGALAIANHLAEFCDQVELVSYLGEVDSREEFIRSRLNPNVRASFVYRKTAPTIVKRRFVDGYSRAKLFGVYEFDDEPLNPSEEQNFFDLIGPRLGQVDVTLASDFGHGLISPAAVELLAREAKFLAVNTQLNSANVGFHTISKYPRADYVCIHEGELRLDARSKSGDLGELLTRLAGRMKSEALMVTRGRQGTLMYRRGDGFSACPAFAEEVVDRIGAGDAVLALSSLCVAAGMPSELVGLLANMAGAQAVAITGNAHAISRSRMIQRLEKLPKTSARRRANHER